MSARAAWAALGIGAIALLLAVCAETPTRITEPARSSSFVNMMIERLGPPDRIEGGRFVWDHRGVWLKIEVRDQLEPSGSAEPPGYIRQTIAYRVPTDRRGALAAFGRALDVSPDGQELAAHSTGEDRNFLLLNLADAIVSGLMTPEAARVDYLRVLTLEAAGKSSPEMSRLLFR